MGTSLLFARHCAKHFKIQSTIGWATCLSLPRTVLVLALKDPCSGKTFSPGTTRTADYSILITKQEKGDTPPTYRWENLPKFTLVNGRTTYSGSLSLIFCTGKQFSRHWIVGTLDALICNMSIALTFLPLIIQNYDLFFFLFTSRGLKHHIWWSPPPNLPFSFNLSQFYSFPHHLSKKEL